MSRFQKCIFLLVPTVFLFIGARQETAPTADIDVAETPIAIGTTYQLKSQILDAQREINVWTPPGYGTGENRYPVLYVVDGGLEQDFHHISGLAQLASINGDYEELIVVGIKTRDRLMELAHQPQDPRYIHEPPRAGKSGVFLKYITQEVIPFVESRYRTDHRRAVIGESLAGLFIAEVFLKHPKSFTDYIVISPSLWWDDQALAKSAATLIKEHDGDPRQLYLTIADEGGTMQHGLDLVVDAIEKNKPAGLTWHYVDRSKTEKHSTIYHGAALEALRKLFALPKPDYGATPWYLMEGGQPPKDKTRDN